MFHSVPRDILAPEPKSLLINTNTAQPTELELVWSYYHWLDYMLPDFNFIIKCNENMETVNKSLMIDFVLVHSFPAKAQCQKGQHFAACKYKMTGLKPNTEHNCKILTVNKFGRRSRAVLLAQPQYTPPC